MCTCPQSGSGPIRKPPLYLFGVDGGRVPPYSTASCSLRLPMTLVLCPTARFAVLALALAAPVARAQSADAFWTDVPSAAVSAGGQRTAALARTLRLNGATMAARLAEAPPEAAGLDAGVEVPLPAPDGSTVWFRVAESPVMEPALQARFPEIRTYVGQGRDDASATVRMSLTPAGFAAMARLPGGAVFVDAAGRAGGGAATYRAYTAEGADVTAEQRAARVDRVEEAGTRADAGRGPSAARPPNGRTLRTYRLAVAATGEYTRFHGGTVASALAAQVTAINRVNQIYETDLAVRLVIVAANDQIVFTDPATDPFTNDNGEALINENQTAVTARIGVANYDVGHVFSTGGGGIAALGVVCNPAFKARGVTGLPNPVGDAFYVDYVAHEIGHQFAANHTFNGNASNCGGGTRNASTAVEPGSGSTIMAYAGICGAAQNIQAFSDPYFHAKSIDEIVAFVTGGVGSTCGTQTDTGNDIPVVSVPAAFTIPAGTPFQLTGSATDATPAALTFVWEGIDSGVGEGGAPSRNGVPTGIPFFRSAPPGASPVRTFPSDLPRLLAGTGPLAGNALPATSQTLRFRLTARDNRAGGGATGEAQVTVTVDSRAGPFSVQTFNAPGATVVGGSTQTVQWNIANTALGLFDEPGPDIDDVDVASVQILYTSDGGASFVPLLTSTPNDGVADVVIPNAVTSQGRLLIVAVGNTFFDVNDAPFAVTLGTASEARAAGERGLSAVSPNPVSGRATLSLRTSSAGPVTVAVYDALGREVARVHDGPVGTDETFTVDVSRLPAGVYVVRASGADVQSTRRFTVVR